MAILRMSRECSANRSTLSSLPGLVVLALHAALGCLVPAAWAAAATGNPIVAENARPGTPGWELTAPATAHEIEGYAGAASLAPGDTVALHVSSASPRFDAEVFRMGWYGGVGARRVLLLRSLPGGRRGIPAPRPTDGLVECAWPVSCRIGTAADWVTGVYLVRLTGVPDGKQSYVPFVLRESVAGAGPAGKNTRHRAPILFQCSVTTWQAYNIWGGKSLYDFNSVGGARAIRVSFDRPYASGPGAWMGLGAGEFLSVDHAPRKGGWEYPFVRWMERGGYDVAYATNLDLDRDSSIGLGRRALLLIGHDEYWSRAMRDHIENARDRGVNLGVFGANVGYWQIRFERSSTGVADRVIFCAKESGRDPVYDSPRDKDLTVRFRNLHPRRPEMSLLGTMFCAENVEGDFVPLPERRGHWVFAGTGIASGRTQRVPGLMGYEVDRAFVGDSLYGRFSPSGLAVLARTLVTPRKESAVPTETAIHTARSGAMVFAAGTIQWSWGLDDWGAPALHPPRRHPDIQGITKNVLDAFLRPSGPSRDRRSPG